MVHRLVVMCFSCFIPTRYLDFVENLPGNVRKCVKMIAIVMVYLERKDFGRTFSNRTAQIYRKLCEKDER